MEDDDESSDDDDESSDYEGEETVADMEDEGEEDPITGSNWFGEDEDDSIVEWELLEDIEENLTNDNDWFGEGEDNQMLVDYVGEEGEISFFQEMFAMESEELFTQLPDIIEDYLQSL
nr:hypothetical protein [Geitlerinema sp. PCC 9228]